MKLSIHSKVHGEAEKAMVVTTHDQHHEMQRQQIKLSMINGEDNGGYA